MKKTLLILALVLGIGLTASLSYAQVPTISNTESNIFPKANVNQEEWEVWHKERLEWKEDQLEKALNDGLITEEEFKTWDEHFKYVKEFHGENGYMPGLCQGGYGFNNENGFRRGYGRGMMRGNRWNR
ncbi:hypothetical protein [Schnuerera sp.]|uniref:hypothetical protein n=1 Tax=Schnuerera sp. TaxID=2794844 RepID=UPI002CC2F018|nr:hypothetical protein [Schnuerera sp.]HSH35952.1 hypothetical protein [Schnuerera sp.]